MTTVSTRKSHPSAVGFNADALLRQLTAELKAGEVRLPSYPDFIVKVQKILEDNGASSARIAQVVAADAALAGRVLRLANSAFFNPDNRHVADLSKAVTQLGRQLLRCTALSFAFKQMESNGPPHLRQHLQGLWRDGILVGSICFVLADQTAAANADESLIAGLMHNVGRLYISVNAQRDAAVAVEEPGLSAFLHEWHPWMGRAILKLWGFSDVIAAAVGGQASTTIGSESTPLTDILSASIALLPSVYDRAKLEGITHEGPFQRLRLNAADCQRALKSSAQKVRSLQATLAG